MDELQERTSGAIPDVLVATLDGFSHVVCTRNGLFAINHHAWTKIADGRYFGATITSRGLVVFEATVEGPDTGRLLRLDLSRPDRFETLGCGLDSGCHQLDVVRGRLTVVDTNNQALVACHQGRASTIARPLPKGAGRTFADGYVHINSVVEAEGLVHVLAHNGGFETRWPSRVLVLDEAWQLVEQFLLPGFGCHNLVFLEDGSLLSCDSLQGNLIDRHQRLAHVDDLFLRGLSVSEDEVVVGASQYALRPSRRQVAGRVHFLDRTYRPRHVLELPAAPTEIRRLRGNDLSLSSANRLDPARLP